MLRTRKKDVTDRAHRYRANQTPPAGPKQCALCGSQRNVVIDHKDGYEEHGWQSNLRWLCKSCNTTLGIRNARMGKGRKTHQYNPGASNLAEYSLAVAEHTRGAHDAAGKVIHETPKSKRREFASEIWARRKARYGSSSSNVPGWVNGRRNPGDDAAAAAEAFEEFHGFPSDEVVLVETPVLEHDHLAVVGELVQLVIYAVDGRHLVTLGNFDGAFLATNGDRNQLYVEGGDQQVSVEDFGLDPEILHESEVLGQLKYATYYTRKTHLPKGQGGVADYTHRFGEEHGEMPHVIYDTRNGLLSFAGGSYTIPAEGIRN